MTRGLDRAGHFCLKDWYVHCTQDEAPHLLSVKLRL